MAVLLIWLLLCSGGLGILFAFYDALAETYQGRIRILNHRPRLWFRTLASVLISVPLLLQGIWLAPVLAFCMLHLVFDPIKNLRVGKKFWYMGLTAKYDAWLNGLGIASKIQAGLLSFIAELLTLLLFLWLSIK